MTDGKKSDVKHSNYMLMPEGSLIVADRAYIDFKMLCRWMKEKITFVIKLKDSIKYEQVEEYPSPKGKAELYKQRWSIETFFKELKEHLKMQCGYRFGQHY